MKQPRLSINTRTINQYEYFFLAVVLNAILPLVPIILEFMFSGFISTESAVLSAAMYAGSIAFTTVYPVFAALNVMASIIFAAVFGFISGSPNRLVFAEQVPIWAIGAILIAHTFEKYVIHVKFGEKYRLFGMG